MKCPLCIGGIAAAALVVGSLALAQNPRDEKPRTPAAPTAPGQDQMPELPPGWTMEDMQACIEAGTPGEMHAHLAKEVGVWAGKTQMWMGPEGEPMDSTCTATITTVMDGRYTKCEINGDMPGMGPFHGIGIYGYDNVSQKFQSTWIDNHSTGIMFGTGDLSSDGKTLTWNYNFNCPVTKKPATMREVEKVTGPNTKTMEMFGTDPKSGKEYKMMSIAFTKQSGGAPTTTRVPTTR